MMAVVCGISGILSKGELTTGDKGKPLKPVLAPPASVFQVRALCGERERKGKQYSRDTYVRKNHQGAQGSADSLALPSEILIQFGSICVCNKPPFQFLKSHYRSGHLSFELLIKKTHSPATLFSGALHVFLWSFVVGAGGRGGISDENI